MSWTVLGALALALQGPTRAEFEHGVADVHALVRGAEWAEARARVLALAERHQAEPWALERRHELLRLLEQATFWSRTEPPSVRDLFTGEVVSWRERSGRIELRYDGAVLDVSEELYASGCGYLSFFDAPFAADLEVRVRGEAYARGSLQPRLWVGLEPWAGLAYAVDLGDGAGGRGAAVSRCAGGELVAIAGAPESELRSGRPFRATVAVDGDEITVRAGRGRPLRVRAGVDVAGYLSLAGLRSFDRVEVEGVLDPEWLDEALGAALQEAWNAFRRETRVQSELPRRLQFGRLRRWSSPAFTPGEIPGPRVEGQETHLRDVLAVLALQGSESALDALDALDTRATTAVFRAWVRGLLLFMDDDWAGALELVEAVCRDDPAFGHAPVVRARCLEELGRHDEALADYRALLDARSERGWLLGRIARVQSSMGRPEAARATMRAALDEGLFGREMDRVSAMLVKAELGPMWDRSWTYESDRFVVSSDIDRATCVEAAETLEVGLARFSSELHDADVRRGRKFRAFVFRSESDYQAYMGDVLGTRMESTAGVYSPQLKQLLIWSDSDEAWVQRVVRHEGFHQYLDLVAPDAPVWLNEGLAEYWELADFTKSRSRMVGPRADLLEWIDPAVGLEDVLTMPAWRFYDEGLPAYAHAWSAVYFLRHSTRENRERFDRFFAGCIDGADPAALAREVFGTGAELARLDREWRAFVAGL